MEGWVSADARDLAAASVGDDRVLVTGASGWLGRTALDLLAPLGLPTLALASRARPIKVAELTVQCRTWDEREVAAFAPTIVLDCAFLTKGFANTMPMQEYVAANRALTDRLVWMTRLPSARLAMTVSSGAAVYPSDAVEGSIEANPYGYLKREAEHRLFEAAEDCATVPVVARAWSISGAHVQDPQNFALGSMIRDASAGSIRISATRPVYRRYVLAEELIALGLAEGGVGPAVIDTGGELVEMAQLASRVAAVIRPDAVISRGDVNPSEPDRYHSDGTDWESRCERWGLATSSLECQIANTARGVLHESS